MKRLLALILAAAAVLAGCTMFTAWKSIPAPGGCNQCHAVSISTNWQATYQAAAVADERGHLPFQTPEYNLALKGKPESPLETKKVEELRCFECHRSPTPEHRELKGRFHH